METEIYPTAITDDGDPAYRTSDLDALVATKEQNSDAETDAPESVEGKVARLRDKLQVLDSDLEDVSRDLTRAIGRSVGRYQRSEKRGRGSELGPRRSCGRRPGEAGRAAPR